MLNVSSNLYRTEWLNLVFKNRNQLYGAYVLRAQSGANTLRALLIAAPLFVLVFISPKIYSRLNGDQSVQIESVPDREVVLELPPVAKVPQPKEEREAPKAEPVKQVVKTVKLPSKPVVVTAPVETEPPTVAEIEKAIVSTVTQEGEPTDMAASPIGGKGNGSGSGSGTGDGTGSGDGTVYDGASVEIYPEFEGGAKAWARFLQRHLRYPAEAIEGGIQGKVFVSFIVERDGSVTNVQLIKGPGHGMNEEAIRVISKSPKWKPGRQNDASVRVRFTMPISFALN